MSKDKKNDDETPAEWVARRSRLPRGYVPVTQQIDAQLDEYHLRRRSPPRKYYQNARHRQPESPLIDRVTNAWRDQKPPIPYHDEYDPVARFCDPDDENSCPNVTSRMARSKKWRRLGLVLLLIFASFLYVWINYILPELEYDYALKAGFLRQPRGTFGLAMGGEYEFAKEKIIQLDNALLPGGSQDPDGKRRLVFVGDIHGCKNELIKLLKQVDFDVTHDHLVATGDMINKGPDSTGVIDELIRLKATSVRGNHEDRVLTLSAIKVDKYGQPEQLSKTAKKDAKLLKHMKNRHLNYLRELPLILRIPRLPLTIDVPKAYKKDILASEILVIHGGLVPAVPLEKQDPYFVMNMRSLAQKTHVPSVDPPYKRPHSVPWTESWNWYQNRLSKGHIIKGWHRPDSGTETKATQLTWSEWLLGLIGRGRAASLKPQPQTAVYGHDSRAGFVNKKWSKGLDSGCVNGGALTALVLDAHGHESFYSVECKDFTQ